MLLHKRIFLALFLLFASAETFSQAFSQEWSVTLPASYESVKSEWGDLDNDGLLDIVLLVQDADGHTYISILKGDTLATPVENSAAKFQVIDSDRFFLFDYNSDNMIDIIVPGSGAVDPVNVYLNRENLTFDEIATTIPSFSKMLFVDLDNDAAPEWVVSHGSRVTTFRRTTGTWLPVDTLEIEAETIESLEADGDGFRDLFVSGKIEMDTVVSVVLINQGQFRYKTASKVYASGTGSVGDVNHDGFFDIILKGRDHDNNVINKIFLSQGGSYSVRDSLFDSIKPSLFIADFNSDGIADVNTWKKDISGDSISLIRTGSNEYDTLPLNNIIEEKFGDADHDGDLDALHVQNGSSITLVLHNNNASLNQPPAAPVDVKAFLFFDHIFIKWQRPNDDHTASRVLTYDIYLENVNPGDFDVLNEKRLKVNHGNNNALDFLLISKPQASTLQFVLESVDNSLHGGGGGICVGGIQGCANLTQEEVTMCSNETRIFNGPSNASWYSFSSGYLSTGPQLSHTASAQDVIFYFDPSNPDCGHLKAWSIQVKDSVREEFVDKFACEGSEIQLEVESSWTSVKWTSAKYGALGTTPTIQYDVVEDDKVNALLSMGTGCSVDREFSIKVSEPDVKITSENTYVLSGKSIQLHGSGADSYLWSPANSIDDPHSPSPTVTPLETTDYLATGYDSLGCSGTETIRIHVEKNGFIPSLFTPNSDGNNDYLRVYGVFDAEEVLFEIFNRNGSKVFSANSVSQLISGWDGTAHGVKQPGGVYFWRVSGKLFSGEKIQFNGKETGSVVLIR